MTNNSDFWLDSPPNQGLAAGASQPDSRAANYAKVLAKRFMEELDQHDLEGVIEMSAPDSKWYVLGRQLAGVKEFMGEIDEVVKEFMEPQLYASEDEAVVAGNEVTVKYCYYFKVKQEDHIKTVKEVRIPGSIVLDIRDHKITEVQFQDDLAARLRQELLIAA
jgi:hypothetical protein